MKKILFYSIIIALGFIYSCKVPVEQKPSVNVGINENFNKVGFIKASIVDGFDHQYDTCKLVVTNQGNSIQYFYNNLQPVFNNISLSEGAYGFYIGTNEADSISSWMEFTAYDMSVNIVKGVNNVTLNAESPQSLILVDKSSVDGMPTVFCGEKVGFMSLQGDYWYCYVKGKCVIEYSINSVKSQIPISGTKHKIYSFVASQGKINISDPFNEVIQI